MEAKAEETREGGERARRMRLPVMRRRAAAEHGSACRISPDDVGMLQLLEQRDLTERRGRHAFVLQLQPDFLRVRQKHVTDRVWVEVSPRFLPSNRQAPVFSAWFSPSSSGKVGAEMGSVQTHADTPIHAKTSTAGLKADQPPPLLLQ